MSAPHRQRARYAARNAPGGRYGLGAALLAAAAATLGCAPAPRPVATDDGWWGTHESLGPGAVSSLPRAAQLPGKPGPLWEGAATAERLTVLDPRGRSEHRAGTVERTVAVNSQASGYSTLGLRTRFPVGSTIVQFHHPPDGTARLEAFVMTKRAPGWAPGQGDWEYLVLDPELRVLERGRLESCARCHAGAQTDSVFGPPRP